MADVSTIYLNALDGKEIRILKAVDSQTVQQEYYYPFRAHHELDTV